MRIQDIMTENTQGVAEGEKQSSVSQLAAVSDEALDKAYGYGRSTPGNTFGWQANLMSAAYAKKMIDAGITDIEKISDAIHKGWNMTAQKFVQNPDQFDDTEKLRQAGKLQAKLQQRAKLMKIGYAELDNDEQEKDRVVARALLQAIKGQQDVTEAFDQPYPFSWEKSANGDVDAIARLDDGNYLTVMFNKGFDSNREPAWSVNFYRNNSQEVTMEGDAYRVFATVLAAMQVFIKKYRPQKIIFAASKETDPTIYYEPDEPVPNPESRAKLYDRMVQRYATALGFAVARTDQESKVIYELSRMKKPGAQR